MATESHSSPRGGLRASAEEFVVPSGGDNTPSLLEIELVWSMTVSGRSLAARAREKVGGTYRKARGLWQKDRAAFTVEMLRVAMGIIWSLDLLFVVDPANQFFPTFAATAASYAPTTLGGPALATWVAANATIFSWIVALGTAYLAIAFLTGLTTRYAAVLGALGSLLLLITQWGSTFGMPGGTDVGPHPLYIAMDLVLFLAPAGRYFSLDAWWASRRAPSPAPEARMAVGPVVPEPGP